MSKIEIMIKRNDAARLLDIHYDKSRNVIKINKGNSLKHELAKFYLSWKLINQDSEVITEAIFKDGISRADVYELDTMTAYEVLFSESMERFKAKREYYNSNVYLVACKTEDLLKELEEELKK